MLRTITSRVPTAVAYALVAGLLVMTLQAAPAPLNAELAGKRRAATPVSGTSRYPSRVAPGTFSTNIDGLWNYSWTWSPESRKAHFDSIARSGITNVRAGLVWEEVQKCRPDPNTCWWGPDWGRHDDWIGAVATAGLQPDLVLGWSALWASSVPGTEFAPPSSSADFAAFAAAVAARYGPGGAFWKLRPDIPYRPVTLYEIWNEQNMTWWWRPYPSPAGYADVYLAARTALRGVDPTATVIVGGLATTIITDGNQVRDTDFVRGMYAARPELVGNVDGLGYHPYAATTSGVLDRVRDVRKTLNAVGASAVPLYINEVGWAAASVGYISESVRASMMKDTIDKLVRSNCGVRQVAPYTWVSNEQNPLEPLDWMGMANRDGSLKPTASGYSQVAKLLQGQGSTKPPSGTFTVC